MSADHLSEETVGAFVDEELPSEAEARVQQHLRECPLCSLRVSTTQRLKSAVRRAANTDPLRYERAAALLSIASGDSPKRAKVVSLPKVMWGSIAAALLFAVGLGTWNRSSQHAALTAELLDQHLAVLAEAATPQVVSTDRHTVKPWFQGKLPFSFNLPEQSALPRDTVLQGADFTYAGGKPAALLLFSIRKHRASVFVTQAGRAADPGWHAYRSGFSISNGRVAGLDLTAVSDVSRSDLDALIESLSRAQ